MSGSQDEASSVLLGLAVNVNYSSFVAVKLPGAEIMTVCFVIAVDFVIQLQLTYQIVKLQNQVTNVAQLSPTQTIENTSCVASVT